MINVLLLRAQSWSRPYSSVITFLHHNFWDLLISWTDFYIIGMRKLGRMTASQGRATPTRWARWRSTTMPSWSHAAWTTRCAIPVLTRKNTGSLRFSLCWCQLRWLVVTMRPAGLQCQWCGEDGFPAQARICSSRGAVAGCVHQGGNVVTCGVVNFEPPSPCFCVIVYCCCFSTACLAEGQEEGLHFGQSGIRSGIWSDPPRRHHCCCGGKRKRTDKEEVKKKSCFHRIQSSFF